MRILVIPLILLALVFAGCSDDDDDADGNATDDIIDNAASDDGEEATAEATADSGGDDGEADTGDACGLLTAAEISGVMGTEYSEGEFNGNQCVYEDASANSVYVDILQDLTPGLDAEVLFEGDLESLEMEEFDGPGDRSGWSSVFTELSMLDGKRLIHIQIADLEPDLSRDRAIALGEMALD